MSTFHIKIRPKSMPGRRLPAAVSFLSSLAFCLLLSSCFTGIEGTKTVSLSKDDRKILAPTPEEEFFKGVNPQPLSEWRQGKQFMAADNKAILIFDQQGLPADPGNVRIAGQIFRFERIEPKAELDGSLSASIVFSGNGTIYRYNTGKPIDSAPSKVRSDQIPMMIDLDMVEKSRQLLNGTSLWIRTPLWYDQNGNRIEGRKFVPVTINDVQPGDITFPLKLKFTDKSGNQAWIFMNYGNSGTETRLFQNLFFLSDVRKRYPAITDDVWEVICRSDVKPGMTKQECKLSLGNPTEVNRGHDYSQTLDLWQYPNGTALWFEDGVLTKYRR